MRLVHCVDRVSQRRLSDNMCPAPKPITMEQCINAGPCFTTPKWLPGNWTQVLKEGVCSMYLMIIYFCSAQFHVVEVTVPEK